ncbi:CarD family transcriptional regulator [Aneurinibacillus sp. Ricciae_BoGa-3]|uniref:CarD family transcriptional regulator n=1 Tax=Aneurinibacillus sp. Ricciae_BoGa-3 TaxID=3022697 RepID=UPI002341DADE|nr:CarD family transcriptional regulator [Aneurinibacillus sp. Ricciae_BoGa-3]WCK54564.1 CarD family transcriptional regulator [Aneurinibacillus sp. Ricciae_BoGa-3]
MEVDFLFQIGDNIVYPMHGAGVIEAIEEKEILGEKQRYYVINMPIGKLQIMVQMGKELNVGLRLAVDILTLESALLVFHNEESNPSLPWNQRYRINMDKMRTGDLQEGAEVVRDLKRRNNVKVLNTSEKRMLDNAWGILISELVLVKECTEKQASDFLNQQVNR